MKTLLFILVAFTGVSSLGAGIMMISNSLENQNSLPLVLPEGAVSHTLISGLFLAMIIGGISIAALFSYISKGKKRFNWSIAAGTTLATWIVLKIIVLQMVHWTDYIYLIMAILIILLAFQLKGKWVV